jgi:hypothetical protein
MNTEDNRRCAGCSRVVSNDNLGGYGGKSALSGMLWCDACTSVAVDFELLSSAERQAQMDAWQAEVKKRDEAALAAKIAEFDHCDWLLARSLLAFRQFRAAPHYAERQHKLLQLMRECFRDVDFIVRDWYWGCKS